MVPCGALLRVFSNLSNDHARHTGSGAARRPARCPGAKRPSESTG